MNSSNRIVSCLLAGLVSGALVAAPAPVASGFPVWQGVTDGNHVAGRRLCPSDLRDKVVVVVGAKKGQTLLYKLCCICLTVGCGIW